ncbi:APC family permease [Bailinhaonella thermotolerans]|uniref:Amino acid permease n=1 Tax=Bailinhaonella thermotolerans TaxID=1070861 RepID=A0A3A4AFJ9_9ACTN|nr:amino acid permease [Bailinhaonella thermotolerans]RJL27129.1 amino acid permease [Bailinhaonella thermotolerans]
MDDGHRLGPAQGTALLLGAVLGPGVLVLPHLAALAAGPAAVLAWAGLLAAGAPVALTFAALGARYPDGGGVATFAARAFGPRVSAITGWWFYLAVPAGVLGAAIGGARYVADGLGLPAGAVTPVAVALLAISFGLNHAGLRVSGPAQLLLAGLLAVLLVGAVAAALPAVRAGSFEPFAPHGWAGVASAVGVLFYGFAGWEAASHLSADFARPRRDLPRATVLAVSVVAVLYLGLSFVTAGALGERAAVSPVPMTLLLGYALGPLAGPVTAVAAVLLSVGAVNAYLAGGSRLGAALARDGAFPAPLARGGGPGLVPHRSLAVLAVLIAALIPLGLDLDTLMRVTAACLAAVTTVGVAAAVRLLPPVRGRRTAVAGLAFALATTAACGAYLLVPAVIAAVAAVLARPRRASAAHAVPVPGERDAGAAAR